MKVDRHVAATTGNCVDVLVRRKSNVIKWPRSQREKTPVTCGQDEVPSVVRFDRREGGKKVAINVEGTEALGKPYFQPR